MTPARWLPVVLVALAAGTVAWLNRGEVVILHLGVATLYRVPLSVVTFAAFLFGMVAMLLLGIRHDLRVREELRRHGLLDRPTPRDPASDDRTLAYPTYDERDAGV